MKYFTKKQLKIILIGLPAIALAAMGALWYASKDAPTVEAAWWNDNWSYRKAIVINHEKVTADLTNFPALVSLTDSNLSTHAQEDGDDFKFILHDTNEVLSHEIESYVSTTGTLVAWVKIPSLSSAEDTVIYMYYGNTAAKNQQDAENVWDENYKGVWHMPDDITSSTTDSTRNKNDGTAIATASTTAIGKNNGSFKFNGNGDYVGVNNHNSLNINGQLALEAWVKPNNVVTHYQSVLSKGGELDITGTTTKLYRSVGWDTSDLNVNSANLTIFNKTAVFSDGLPDNIGAGDVLQYGGSGYYKLAFISGRTSSTTYSVQAWNGSTPIATTSAAVNIYRAHLKLENWEAQTLAKVNSSIDSSVNGNILVGQNLIASNTVMMVACYASTTADDTLATIAGWTTGVNNYIKIYTPYLGSEVGKSQRHSGKWDASKYRLETVGGAISAQTNYLHIEGLQVQITANNWSNRVAINVQSLASVIKISHNIVKGVIIGTSDYCYGIYVYNIGFTVKVWNNIVYDFYNTTSQANNRGISIRASANSRIYNNTVYNCYAGYWTDTSGTLLKNNIAASSTVGFSGTFNSASAKNASLDGTSASSTADRINQTFTFADADNDDFHLTSFDAGAKNYGLDLSGDSGLAFSDDADSQIRIGTWDIGADEFGMATTSKINYGLFILNDELAMRWDDGEDFRLFLTDSANLTASQWAHVVYSRDLTNEAIYVNGNLVKQNSFDYLLLTNYQNLYIASPNYFDGQIDEMRVSDIARSADWIDTSYNNQNAPESFSIAQAEEVGPGPVGYWTFDEGYGATAYDESGQGNNGTVTGATWNDESMCVSGKCLYFDGSGDYVTVSDSSILDPANVTIAAWIKLSTSTSGLYIAGKSNASVASPATVKIKNIVGDKDAYSYEVGHPSWSAARSASGAGVQKANLGPRWSNESGYNIIRGHLQFDVTSLPNNAIISDVGLYLRAEGVGASCATYCATYAVNGDRKNEITCGADPFIGGNYDAPLLGTAFELYSDEAPINGSYSNGDWVSWNFNSTGTNAVDNVKSSGCVEISIVGGFDYSSTTPTIDTGMQWNDGDDSGFEPYLNITYSTSTDSAASDIPFALSTVGGGQFMLMSASSTHAATSTTGINDSNWHHLSGTYDGSIMKLYLDGILVDTNTDFSGDLPIVDGSLHIGADYEASPGNFFHGFIDEVKIYPYARTADEIKQDYVAGLAGIKTTHGVSASFGGSSDSWMSDGLVGYWKMDESATTSGAIDSSGNGNTGTYYGNASTTGGKFGNGGVFATSSGDYVDAGSGSSLNLTVGTVSAWIKIPSVPANGAWWAVADKQNRSTSRNGYALSIRGLSGGAKLYIDLCDASSGQYVVGNTVMTANKWYNLAFTWDGDYIKGYVNGELDANPEAQTIIPISDVYNLNIGKTPGGSYPSYFDGRIDEVRIYNRALSPAEVRKLYEWAPGPVAHWKMDDYVKGGSKTIIDSAASTTFSGGNHGTTNDGANNTGMDCTKPGKYGTACEFDGVDDYVSTIDSNSLDLNSAFTISLWGNQKTIVEYGGLVTKHLGSDGNRGYFIRTESTDEIRVVLSEDGTNYESDESSNNCGFTANNEWTYIAVNFIPGNITYYKNGILCDTDTTAINSIFNNDETLDIGIYGTYYFDGLIDDVRIYNYARTQKQILEDMAGKQSGSSIGARLLPVLHLSFDEGYGATAHDSSIHKNHGTLYPGTGGTNTASSAMWSLDGKYGRAMEFDGTDDYIGIADSSQTGLDLSDNFTISAWVNFGSNQGGEAIGKDSTNNSCSYRMNLSGNRRVNFYTCTNGFYGTGIDIKSDPLLPFNTWVQISITYNGSTVRLYKDGVEINSGDFPYNWSGSVYNSASPFTVGGVQISDTWYYFDGLIDEVKIWNYALTEDEVKTEYNRGASAVMGSVSSETSATSSNAASRAYCVPGSSDYCAPPVLELKFDEGQGTTTYDTSGHGNDGVFVNKASSPRWSEFGKINNAVEFDGVNDYVDLQSPAILDDLGPMSITAWINPKSLGGVSSGAIISKDNLGTGWWKFTLYPNNNLYFSKEGSGLNLMKFSNNDSINLNIWQHVAITWDGSTDNTNVNLYVNSIDKSDIGVSGIDLRTDNAIDINVGNNTLNTYPFDGIIDDVRIYNYVRTPAQIAWDYDKGKPIAYWNFDECKGGTIYDHSGNGNHGTLQLGDTDITATGTCASSSASFWYNGRSGKYSSAGSFDGTDDYVKIADSGSISVGAADYTISAWIFPDYTSNARTIISKVKDPADKELLFEVNNGILRLHVEKDANNGQAGTAEAIVQVSTWQHVAVVFNGTTSPPIFYYNGSTQILGSNTIDNPPDQLDDDLYIGIRGGTYMDYFFDGLIDEVKLWNYALTAEQVRTEYNGGAVRFGD